MVQPAYRRLALLLFLIPSGLLGCAQDRPIYYQISSKYTVRDPQFARTVGNLLGPSLVSGNQVTTLLNGDQIFPAMLEAMRAAQKSITFETYIYWKGTIGREFADVLAERAGKGVRVRVLIDWIGGDKIDKDYVKKMTDAGAEVKEYHAFHVYDIDTWRNIDHRTHRKVLVVDGVIGFTGGVGIADEWRGNAESPAHWRDNHYRVEGPVVCQLQAAFCDNWMQTTGHVLEGDIYFPPTQQRGKMWGQVFQSSSTGGSENMELLFLLSIAAAGDNIRMENAYFVPDSLTRKRLVEARKRGVKVQVIVPGKHIDEQVVRNASRAHWGELLKEGVEIYEFQPTMIHAKLLVVDDYWVSIGSSNLDNRSFRINDEANLNVMDEKFAAEQIGVFDNDLKRCKRITYEAWGKRPLGEKINDAFSTLLEWEI